MHVLARPPEARELPCTWRIRALAGHPTCRPNHSTPPYSSPPSVTWFHPHWPP